MVQTITYWSTLMRKAHALGQARLSGDPERIAAAERDHGVYKIACLASDSLVLDVPVSIDATYSPRQLNGYDDSFDGRG